MEALTALLAPLLLFGTALYSLAKKQDVSAALLEGGRNGLRILGSIFPSLVMLLCAVQMLRASGALEALTKLLAPVAARCGLPVETLPLVLVRPISGSAALAVGAELVAQYGVDSAVGRTAAIMLGSTETTFYTVSVYFGAAGVRKTRWAIPAALIADLTGFLVAALAARLI